jgi:flagellar biosynthetic protein FlhB
MALPIVITSGKGFFAQLIMMIARKNRVLILRRPPLARALFQDAQPGTPISLKHQNAVAKVYRWVVSMPGNKVLQS